MSSLSEWERWIDQHLQALSVGIGSRPVGSEANRRAQSYIAQVMEAAGLAVEEQAFDCLDWELREVCLALGKATLPVRANPFTPACEMTARTVAADSLDALADCAMEGKAILLHGALTTEPLFPKAFPFFTVEEHQQIIRLLEEGRPAAVIAISHQPSRPAPIIEDGDFHFPSVTVAAGAGSRLLAQVGEAVTLHIDSVLRPAKGANVIGRWRSDVDKKVVVCAHYDTKHGTPGAVDNAAGVAALLALGSSLKGQDPGVGVELVAFDGEDYYSSPGQVAYLAAYGAAVKDALLAINMDGVGLRDVPNTVAFFGCPEELVRAATDWIAARSDLVVGEPWPQGDHMLFVYQGVPSIALTSQGIEHLIDSVIHTPDDTIQLLSPARLAGVVELLHTLLALAR